MRIIQTLALLTSLVTFAACTSEAAATANPAATAASITKLLTGITDGKTAEAAKAQLETLTGTFGKAVEGLKSAGAAAGGEAGGAITDLAKKAAGAISPELTKSFSGITAQITRLMSLEGVTAAIGPMLEKLKALIPA